MTLVDSSQEGLPYGDGKRYTVESYKAMANKFTETMYGNVRAGLQPHHLQRPPFPSVPSWRHLSIGRPLVYPCSRARAPPRC